LDYFKGKIITIISYGLSKKFNIFLFIYKINLYEISKKYIKFHYMFYMVTYLVL